MGVKGNTNIGSTMKVKTKKRQCHDVSDDGRKEVNTKNGSVMTILIMDVKKRYAKHSSVMTYLMMGKLKKVNADLLLHLFKR